MKVKESINKQNNGILDKISGIKDFEIRKNAFLSLLAVDVFYNYLANSSLKPVPDVRCQDISKILEEFDLAEISLGNARIGVRAVYGDETNYLRIPRKQFDFALVPSVYVAVRIYNDFQSAEILGAIEPSKIDKTLCDDDYVYVKNSSLDTIEKLSEIIAEAKQQNTAFLSVDHEKIQEKFLDFAENKLEGKSLKAFMQHLSNCPSCRCELKTFYDFNMKLQNTSKNGLDLKTVFEGDEITSDDGKNNEQYLEAKDIEPKEFAEYLQKKINNDPDAVLNSKPKNQPETDAQKNDKENINEPENETKTEQVFKNLAEKVREPFSEFSLRLVEEELDELESDLSDLPPHDWNIENEEIELKLNPEEDKHFEEIYERPEEINEIEEDRIFPLADEIETEEFISEPHICAENDEKQQEAEIFVPFPTEINSEIPAENINDSKLEEMLSNLDDIEIVNNLENKKAQFQPEEITPEAHEREIMIQPAQEIILDEQEPEKNVKPKDDDENLLGLEKKVRQDFAQDDDYVLENISEKAKNFELPPKKTAKPKKAQKLPVVKIAVAAIIILVAGGQFVLTKFKQKSEADSLNQLNELQNIQNPAGIQPVTNAASQNLNSINDVIPNAFGEAENLFRISNITWEVNESLANNPTFRSYLMNSGMNLKKLLSKNLLSVNEKIPNDKIKVIAVFDSNGKLKSAAIDISSGSKKADGIALDTVKQNLDSSKFPAVINGSDTIEAGIIINL